MKIAAGPVLRAYVPELDRFASDPKQTAACTDDLASQGVATEGVIPLPNGQTLRTLRTAVDAGSVTTDLAELLQTYLQGQYPAANLGSASVVGTGVVFSSAKAGFAVHDAIDSGRYEEAAGPLLHAAACWVDELARRAPGIHPRTIATVTFLLKVGARVVEQATASDKAPVVYAVSIQTGPTATSEMAPR